MTLLPDIKCERIQECDSLLINMIIAVDIVVTPTMLDLTRIASLKNQSRFHVEQPSPRAS